MKISLFCEHILPRPWTEDSEYNRLQNSLEQFVLADDIGFHAVWMPEHHFTEEYCHSSAPDVFFAAVAARTRNIRLGHGIYHTPPPINHPARIAERVSVLDLISDGRVELGTGESSSAVEIDGFHFDPADKRAMWDEAVDVIVRCMADTPFTGIDGKFVTMPPRNVVPKPRQKPHPPLWLACTRQETIELAARAGMGALSFSFTGPERFGERVRQYYDTFEAEAVPKGRFPNPNILASAGQLFLAPTTDEAFAGVGDSGGFFSFGIRHYYQDGDHLPGHTGVWDKYIEGVRANPNYDPRADPRLGGVGSPDDVRDYLRRFEEVGVDQIMFLLPPLPHERIMESLEMMRTVIPEFHERDEKLVEEKSRRLEPAVEAAMARRVDNDPPLDENYRTGAIPIYWDGVGRATETLEAAEQIAKEMAENAAREASQS